MWTLYSKAKLFSRLPSELLRLDDEWMAYQFDNAVATFGIAVENALMERENRGTDKQPKWDAKYTLSQLLDDSFRLPAPAKVEKPQGLKGLMGMPGVKVLKAKG